MRLGTGFAVLSYAVFALGLAGLLFRPVLVSLLAAGLLCAVLFRDDLFAALRRPRASVRFAVGALVALALAVPLFLQPLYPPVDGDSTAYHLAAAKLYLQSHRLIVTTYLRFPVFPQFQEMLFTLAMGVFDDVTAHLVSFTMWIGVALALAALGRRLGDRDAGWVAAGLWIGGPTGLNFGSNGYVDVGLTFYVTLSILAWLHFSQSGRTRWAALAGVLVGAAAGVKYSGLFFVAALGVAVALFAPRGKRLAPLGAYLALAVAVALPWYARNWALSGDPLFPFLGQTLGHGYWSADDLHRQVADFRSYNLGATPIDFLRLWDRLAFNQGMFVGPEDLFSPALWIPLPLLLIALWKRAHERTLLLLAFAYLLIWFVSAQAGRYLLPVIPILCLALGRILSGGLQAIRRHAGDPVVQGGAAPWALAALLALCGSWYALDRTRARGMPPARAAERREFITRAYPSYPAYEWLNRQGGSYSVYAWRDGTMAYFADGRFLGDWFGPARYARIESVMPDGEAVADTLRAMGAEYLLVPTAVGPTRLPVEPSFLARARLVYACPGARVFALDRPGSPD